MATPRKYRDPKPVIPGRRFDTPFGGDPTDRDIYKRLQDLEKGGLQIGTTRSGAGTTVAAAGSEGDVLTFTGGAWMPQKNVTRSLAVGMPIASAHKFEVDISVSGTRDQKLYFTSTATVNSSLRGLHLQKLSTNADRLGITLDYDTGPVWDACALGATTTDLVLAYSHALKTDNVRLRQDTAQMNVGRNVAQPLLVGSQIQVNAGNAATITGITKATSAVVTVGASHLFAVGELVNFISVVGMVEINGLSGTISSMTSTTITVGINSTGFSTYTSGGTAYVTMNGLRLVFFGNSNGFAFFQGLSSSVTKRVKQNYNNVFQMGTDLDQNATGDFWIANNATGNAPFYLSPTDKCFIGGGGPAPTATAKLHIGAGAAAASGAPLKLTSGTNLTAPEAGAVEYNGTHFFVTPGTLGTRESIAWVDQPGAAQNGQFIRWNDASGKWEHAAVSSSFEAVATKTANYTLTGSDGTILGSTTGGAFTLILPTAVGRTGQRFTIKKIGTSTVNDLTVTMNGAETADGNTSVIISLLYTSLDFRSDGTNYQIV